MGCGHDAMSSHPIKRLRRAAQRQIGALEKGHHPLGAHELGANHVRLLFTGSINHRAVGVRIGPQHS
jgi:hypothetical protein